MPRRSRSLNRGRYAARRLPLPVHHRSSHWPTAGSRAEPRSIFVLDTNVMMHDPSAIFRFEEHDIFIPMTVLEELDAGKKGVSEAARNVRQVSRFLDELMASADKSADRPRARAAFGQIRTVRQEAAERTPVLPDTAAARAACPTRCPVTAPTTRSSRRRSRCSSSSRTPRSRWCRRTSTCASRPRSSASTPRTTTATRRSRTPTCSTRASRSCPANFWDKAGRKLESWHEQRRSHVLPRARQARRELGTEPVRVPGRRARHRGASCVRSRATRP